MDYLQGQVFEKYSSHNLDRLHGSKPEKESSKAVVKLIEQKLSVGSKILEVGCSSGHLLKTLNNKNLALKYVGIDIDRYAIKKGNESIANLKFPGIKNAQLLESNVEDLPFNDNEFDIVVSLNVIEHLHEPKKAIKEMLRCAKNFVAIRTLMSEQTYIVKEVRNANHKELGYDHLDLPEPKDELDEFGNPKVYVYQNVYSKDLISGILHEQTDVKTWNIFEDDMFDQKAFDLDNKGSNLPRITKVIGGKQVRGLFIDTNYWITVEK
jgi:ubiquinone/menaquinone biosynthesis C-methylase UbiE